MGGGSAPSTGRAHDHDQDIFWVVPPESLAGLRDPWIRLWARASNAQGAIDFAGPVGPGPVEPLVDAELRSAGAGLSAIGVIVSPGEVQELARQPSLRQLRLTARSGLGLETFYAGLGYDVIGRHPDAVQIGPDRFRDEIIMLKGL